MEWRSISTNMHRDPNGSLFSRLKRATLVAAITGATLAIAQIPPPGKDVNVPPPQPGQLGAPDNSPKKADPTKDGESTATVPGDDGVYKIGGVTVRYVLVPTTVLDPDGHGYVNGLNVKDFTVYDNGIVQKISSEVTQQPVSVVLAVQANSEVEPLLPTIRKSGILLQGLVTGQEGDAAILAFDHRMQVLQDFTNDPSKLDDAMQKMTSGSSTAAIIDAVREADRMLVRHDRQNARRRVVILMSRNVDKGSQAKLDETVRDMQFDNVIVYCVDISKVKTALLKKPDYPRPPNGGQPASAQPSIIGQTPSETNVVSQMNGNALNGIPPIYRGIRDLFKKSPAEAFTYFTGGQTYSFSNQRGLEDAITDIGKDLNSQYILSYSLSNKQEPGFHNIKVDVDRPGLQVRTRPGYWWGGGQQ
jgi:VWFA-related protein